MPKNIVSFLYILLIYCVSFEEMLGRMKWSFLTSIKYLILIVLFVKILLCKKKTKFTSLIQRPIIFFYAILMLYVFFSVPDFFALGWDGLIVWKGFLFLPLFVYVFTYSNLICSLSSEDLITHFVKSMIVYSFFDIFLYFYEIDIWRDYHFYWGRIGVGYSTIDVVTMSISLILLWFYDKLNVNFYCKLFGGLVILLAILGQTSGTGLVLLVILLLSAITYLFNLKKNNVIKSSKNVIILSFLIISLLFSIVIQFLQTYHNELYENMLLQVENRYNVLIGKETQTGLQKNTMDIREMEFVEAQKTDFVSIVLGTGYGRLTFNPVHSSSVHFLESLYHILRIAIGWVGTIMFYFILFCMFVKNIKGTNIRNKYVYVPILLCVFASTFTSGSILALGIAGSIGLIISDFNQTRIKLVK